MGYFGNLVRVATQECQLPFTLPVMLAEDPHTHASLASPIGGPRSWPLETFSAALETAVFSYLASRLARWITSKDTSSSSQTRLRRKELHDNHNIPLPPRKNRALALARALTRVCVQWPVLLLHGINIFLCLGIAVAVVWWSEGSPVFGFAYLFTAVILWMKLISYAHCNRDLRLAWREKALAAKRKGADGGGEGGGGGGDPAAAAERWRGGGTGGWSVEGFSDGGQQQQQQQQQVSRTVMHIEKIRSNSGRAGGGQ